MQYQKLLNTTRFNYLVSNISLYDRLNVLCIKGDYLDLIYKIIIIIINIINKKIKKKLANDFNIGYNHFFLKSIFTLIKSSSIDLLPFFFNCFNFI